MKTPKIRGYDKHGAGHYLAQRIGYIHKAVDFCSEIGGIVKALSPGVCTRHGYPYSPVDKEKGHLRYVEIQDKDGLKVRYFYCEPLIDSGEIIKIGDPVGVSQDLTKTYKGITQHYHFEVKTKSGMYINPLSYLEHIKATRRV